MHCEVACEVLWSILKGHWGCSQQTAQAVITAGLLAPDFASPTHWDQLVKIAQVSPGAMTCPVIDLVLKGAKFSKISVIARDFGDAHSINKGHPLFRDLAAQAAAAQPPNLHHGSLYNAILAGKFGSAASQSDAWDGNTNDPNDFQRTVWVACAGSNGMVLEGVNRSTAIARAVAAGDIDPDAVFAAYELVIPATT